MRIEIPTQKVEDGGSAGFSKKPDGGCLVFDIVNIQGDCIVLEYRPPPALAGQKTDDTFVVKFAVKLKEIRQVTKFL